MKYLIAGACMTIMAAGAYYGITEFNAYRQRSALSESTEIARAKLVQLAGAEKGDTTTVREFCRRAEASLDDEASDAFRQVITNCRTLGYL